MQTITSKRERRDFFKRQVEGTTLFFRQLLIQLYTQQKQTMAGKEPRDIIIALKTNGILRIVFEQTAQKRYGQLQNTIEACCEAQVQLMYIDNDSVVREAGRCIPQFHHTLYMSLLQYIYESPSIVTRVDDDDGTLHHKLKDFWTQFICNNIQIKHTGITCPVPQISLDRPEEVVPTYKTPPPRFDIDIP